MGKIQFPNLRALPAGPRWLAYGVLLLCAILVGGVITCLLYTSPSPRDS